MSGICILLIVLSLSGVVANTGGNGGPSDSARFENSYFQQQGMPPGEMIPQQPAGYYENKPPQERQWSGSSPHHQHQHHQPQHQQYQVRPPAPWNQGGLLSRIKSSLSSVQSKLSSGLDNIGIGGSGEGHQYQPYHQQYGYGYSNGNNYERSGSSTSGSNFDPNYAQQQQLNLQQQYQQQPQQDMFNSAASPSPQPVFGDIGDQHQYQQNPPYTHGPQQQYPPYQGDRGYGGGGGGGPPPIPYEQQFQYPSPSATAAAAAAAASSSATQAAQAAAAAAGEIVDKVRSYLTPSNNDGSINNQLNHHQQQQWGYPPPQQQQQKLQQQNFHPYSSDGEGVDTDPYLQQSQSPQLQKPQQSLAATAAATAVIPADPQVFAVGNSVVMILRPREFYRKKAALTRGGASALQVFTDFENVMTRFKLPAGTIGSGGVGGDLDSAEDSAGGSGGERTVSTAELLERSRALLPAAQQRLHDILSEAADQQLQNEQQQAAAVVASAAATEQENIDILALDDDEGNSIKNSAVEDAAYRRAYFNEGGVGRVSKVTEARPGSSTTTPSMSDTTASTSDAVDAVDHAVFEALTAKCQDIVANEGGLLYSSFEPLVREAGHRLGLRSGACETVLQALSSKSVPTYIFSAGYGDVVSQVLQQQHQKYGGAGGGSSSSNRAATLGAPVPGAGGLLPNNIRVISNFGRTAPDGTVRAFSVPIVHERNKNAGTAARVLDMPLPRGRPNALVLGSQEGDVQMTDGLEGLQEQLSIGFMELTSDMPHRLPSFLNTFDAVVVGDGSFEFVRSLVDDVLQLPPSAAAGGWQAGRAARGLFGRPLGGFFSSGGSSISGSNGGNGNREGGVRGI